MNPRPFEYVKGQRMLGYSADMLNCISVDESGQITVCFNVFKLVTIPRQCRMYDAPHLICWNSDNTEVGFFASYDNVDCICVVRRESDKAMMWYLHGVPTEVILEPSLSDPNKLRITPVVRGLHAFISPFNFDDFEMVECWVRGVKKLSEPEEQPPVDYFGLAAAEEKIPDKEDKKSNKWVVLSMVGVSVCWIAATILLAVSGQGRSAGALGGIGGLAVVAAVNWRLASRYKIQTSLKSMRWRVALFFILTFSSATYQIARGVHNLVALVLGAQPSVGVLLLVESVMLISLPVVYARKSLNPDVKSYNNRLAWLRMISIALWIGCAVFAAHLLKG